MTKRKLAREGRTFGPEFKAEVLELARLDAKSVAQICRDLDLTESAVRNWIRRDEQNNGTPPQNSLSRTDQDELVRLRAENRRLQMERDI